MSYADERIVARAIEVLASAPVEQLMHHYCGDPARDAHILVDGAALLALLEAVERVYPGAQAGLRATLEQLNAPPAPPAPSAPSVSAAARAAIFELAAAELVDVDATHGRRARVWLAGPLAELGDTVSAMARGVYAGLINAHAGGRPYVLFAELVDDERVEQPGRVRGVSPDDQAMTPGPCMIVLPGLDEFGPDRVVYPVTYTTADGQLSHRDFIGAGEIDQRITESAAAGWAIDDRRNCPPPVLPVGEAGA